MLFLQLEDEKITVGTALPKYRKYGILQGRSTNLHLVFLSA